MGQQWLEIYSDREVVIVKPAACRHWLRVAALADARNVLVASFESPAHVPSTVNVADFDRAGVEFVDPREGARG